MNDRSLSGLTEEEAKEFHGQFVVGFILFALLALAAHLMVWSVRPWGWLSQRVSLDGDTSVALSTLTNFIS